MVSLASATITLSTQSDLPQASGSFNITVTTDQNETIDFSLSTITNDGKTITFILSNSSLIFNESNGYSSVITVTYNVPADFDFEFAQTYATTFTANGNVSGNKTQSISFAQSDFCSYDTLEDLEISIEDLKVKEGFGDDEDYWYAFDVIEAEIEVVNDGNYDMEDIEVSWALYTADGNKITDDEESDFNLDSDDDKILTLTFALDDDVDEFEDVDELTLYVKAQGKIDDNDAGSNDGETTCVEDSQDVDLTSDDDFVVLDDIEVNGMLLKDLILDQSFACGTELQIVADVWNVGDSDQDDVTVLILNNELGISETVVIGDIDAFDNEKLEKTITIPADAEAKAYTFDLIIFDEDTDIFETDEENTKAIFRMIVDVEGNCKVIDSALITATLTSEAQSGEQLTVKTTITNTEDKAVTYTLNINGHETWATLEDVIETLTLVAGESREITLTFDVNKGISGNKVFNIEAVADSESLTTQPVSVSIAPQKGLFGGIKLPENNLYLWGIGALNALLILAIVIVAIRLSKD